MFRWSRWQLKPAPRRGEPGVVLRVTLNGAPLVVSDSVRLHYLAKYCGTGADGYYAILPPCQLAGDASQLVISVKPIMTTDHPTGE